MRSIPLSPPTMPVVPKAAQLVADTIREWIIEGEVGSHERLPDFPTLVTTFGVSRPTMREALNLLQTEGLIQLKRGPGGGAIAVHPDSTHATLTLGHLLRLEGTNLGQLMEFRVAVEPAAAALAAARLTGDELHRLRDLVHAQLLAVGDEVEWFRLNLEFHSLIASSSRNPLFRILIEASRSLIKETAVGAHMTRSDRESSTAQHDELLARLIDRDAAGAERRMREHLETSVYVRRRMVKLAYGGRRHGTRRARDV